MYLQDTFHPYRDVKRDPIQYSYCVDYSHLCRYKGLRQVIHQGVTGDRYIALETVNPIPDTIQSFKYYTVPYHLENRLDLIAEQQLGSASYAWVLAYYNKIQDGFTAIEGTQLIIPTSISSLFNRGHILESLPATRLNLGSE